MPVRFTSAVRACAAGMCAAAVQQCSACKREAVLLAGGSWASEGAPRASHHAAALPALPSLPAKQALFAKAAASSKLTPLVVERKKYLKAVAAVSFGRHACIARRPAANCVGA